MPISLSDTRSLSDEVIAELRQRAMRARELGYTLTETSEILGVAVETISRWWSAYQKGGTEAMPQRRTGRPIGSGRTLSDKQAERIQQLIDEHVPEELGIASALWTRRAIQELIKNELEIKMPLRTIGDYLRRWGYTPQKPARKSYKQDPEEVRHWLEVEFPAIQARADAEGGEIHWGDEAGVRSTCQVGRGYSRKGKTPELRIPGNRFSVNVISSVSNQGTLRFMTYEGRMTAKRFIEFLSRLIRDGQRKIFLIVDNLSVHDAGLVKEWLEGKEDRIEVHFLPKYAPELNPDEYLNCDIKTGVNAKGLPHSRDDLKANLRSFLHMLGKLPERIASYFQHPCIQYAAASK
jgi:transposase